MKAHGGRTGAERPRAARSAPTLDTERLHAAVLSLDARLGLGLDSQQAQRLTGYFGLLDRWNRVYNLTALAAGESWATHHLADTLTALAAIRRRLPEMGIAPDASLALADIGSGGGLPAVPFAVAQPHWQVHAVDTVDKKVSFIRQVGAELGLDNLQAWKARVEALGTQAPRLAASQNLITSRAFASLNDFTRLSRDLLHPQGHWVALKGRVPDEEIQALATDPTAVADVFHVEHLDVPDLPAERCLVWLRPRPAS